MRCKFTELWRRFGLLPGGEAVLSKLAMSVQGHEQTSRHIRLMSVIPLKAEKRFARPLSAINRHLYGTSPKFERLQEKPRRRGRRKSAGA